MNVIALDTLKYTKKLVSVGVSQQQAEAQAEALAEITADQLATKYDLKELEINLKSEIHQTQTKLSKLVVVSISIATAILGILISVHH